jgi:ParB family chromosome partitioning protein
MSSKKRGLGKGLNALLAATLINNEAASMTAELMGVAGSAEQTENALPVQKIEADVLVTLLTEHIHPGPYQPRQTIQHEGIEQLAESIRTQGVIQPIVVRQVGVSEYELVAGERRWRAAQLAGLNNIPAIVKKIPDNVAMILALIENIQREDLTAIEEAKALKRLSDELHLTHLQVAEAVGKSRASVTNLLRLLTLNPDVQALLEEGKIELGHAKTLLGVRGTLQSQVASTVATRGLSVRETEKLVSKLQENQLDSPKKPESMDPNIRRLEEDLADKLGAPVNIRHSARNGQGMVVIRYNDVDALQGILAHFK